MPFCYGQTSPLGVPMYAFGFGLTIQALFFLSPIAGAVKTCFFTAPIFLPAAAFFVRGIVFRLPYCFYVRSRSVPKNNTHRNQNPFELLSFKTLTRSTPAFIIIPLTAAKIKVYGAINFCNIGTANP